MQSSDSKVLFINSGIFFLLLLFIPIVSYSQKWELGGALGGGNYQGDVTPAFRFENYRPAGGIFGRYNFSQVVSVKVGINGIQSKGSTKYYNQPYHNIASYNFIRFVGEVAGQVEYNFFNYRDEKSRRNWTPYFFVGAGAMYMFGKTSGASALQPVIPTGVGFRYILGGKWNLGLELGARKTFTDYFDRISYDENTLFPAFNGNSHDRDWYFFTALSVSYTIYTIPCPFTYH